MLTVGSDFSGVGAFNQALRRLGVEYHEVFACDMDKYARQTFIHNYGEPEYYPLNVYDREIPSEPLDIYMTSPPCQAFSMAGKRLGKEDKRGVLFFNSHEFIKLNKPRFFIFENVKGLLSDDNGNTFNEWVNLLGGKSVNGNVVLFPHEDAVPYHLYWKVLNAKNHGIPQNRERVFLVGIRDDQDNNFRFPVEEHLNKRLKDILQPEVLNKFYLSEQAIDKCLKRQANKNMLIKEVSDISKCIVAGYYKIPFDGQYIKIESNLEKYFLSEKMVNWISDHRDKRDSTNKFPMNESDIGGCVTARYFKMGAEDPYIKIKSATSTGFEIATEGDSISLAHPGSETRRGRVGHDVAQTLDTECQQGVVYNCKRLNQTLEKNNLPSGEVKAIDTYNRKVQDNAPTLTEPHHNTTRLWDGYKIRRLTPRECFRLMDFPDTFTWTVSDSQAYKQAGNSIVVNILYKILKNLIK